MYLCIGIKFDECPITTGLTGFDSKQSGYVSMPSLAMTLVNPDREQ